MCLIVRPSPLIDCFTASVTGWYRMLMRVFALKRVCVLAAILHIHAPCIEAGRYYCNTGAFPSSSRIYS